MQRVSENILNVTLLEPRLKHPTIFQHFDELAEGDSLTIHNDHDPKPLYYQLIAERGNVFTWEYLEQGPTWWKVKISKRLSSESDETLGQLVAKDHYKAQIFKKYGLDFCCGGKKTVKEACKELGLDVTKVEQELQQPAVKSTSRPLPYNEWSPDFLADYIVNTHHTYVRKNLKDIMTYAEKVMNVHGNSHPELNKVWQLVQELNNDLLAHLPKEEEVVFPYIKKLVSVKNNTQLVSLADLKNGRQGVDLLENEHEAVGKNLHELRAITNNYTLPEDACASYTLLFNMLDEFEEDTHLHIHLENNILFPKAIELEKQLNN
ncbi:MAG: iron-sulfur cluster repair di-iron protein [Chitinophagaceae bacterium]